MIKYVITAVHMNADRSKIAKVKGLTDGLFGRTDFEQSRIDVIIRISSQSGEYRTYKTVNGIEVQGPLVQIVPGLHGPYIRTDANNTEADNLGELPEY